MYAYSGPAVDFDCFLTSPIAGWAASTRASNAEMGSAGAAAVAMGGKPRATGATQITKGEALPTAFRYLVSRRGCARVALSDGQGGVADSVKVPMVHLPPIGQLTIDTGTWTLASRFLCPSLLSLASLGQLRVRREWSATLATTFVGPDASRVASWERVTSEAVDRMLRRHKDDEGGVGGGALAWRGQSLAAQRCRHGMRNAHGKACM